MTLPSKTPDAEDRGLYLQHPRPIYASPRQEYKAFGPLIIKTIQWYMLSNDMSAPTNDASGHSQKSRRHF